MAKKLAEGTKHDQGKTRYDLLSPSFLRGTADVLEFGAGKYEPYNWLKGILFSRVYRAALGHLISWFEGENLDPETGINHLFHAACCIMFLSHYVSSDEFLEYDDRPYKEGSS